MGYHFYKKRPDGSIETAHDLSMGDAVKQGAFGSVTTALALWKNEYLENIWGPKKLVLETESNPRLPNESDEDYVARIVQLKWGVRTRWDGVEFPSNDFGTEIHNELERWNLDHSYQFNPVWEMYCTGWPPLFQANLRETVAAELLVADDHYWIAGTIDLLALGHDGRLCLVDYKCRGEFRNGKGSTYDKDVHQLAIEADIIRKQYSLDYFPQCISVIIDSTSGDYYWKQWTPYMMAKGLRQAQAIVRCFNVMNGFQKEDETDG